ncbi:MAG TPA: hypothetical protein VFE42_33015 [Chloroflexota bacterium]|nr:hypothetical protein [Chloroflexota bacterium]
MSWLDDLLDEPRADSTVGRADALQESLDAADVAAVFAARLSARLARAWASAEDLLVQLDRCIGALSTRNREDALLSLVRGRDAGLVFHRDIRNLLDTWWAWEETLADSGGDGRPSAQESPAAGGQAIRAAVEERLGDRDVREGLYDLGCPDEISARFADDVHDLYHELAAFLSNVERLATTPPEDLDSCRDLLYKLMETWDPGLVTHGAWHLGSFEDDDQGLYRPGMLGWGLAVMDYLRA